MAALEQSEAACPRIEEMWTTEEEKEKTMTTPEMLRCKKCDNLVIKDDGTWTCKETETDIQDIPDEECPLEADY